MTGNRFGRIFSLTTYGESHGPGLGGIVEGCPAGVFLSEADIQKELDARRPGAGGCGGAAGTGRSEPDAVRILSGVFEGRTTGTPIAFHVENTNQRPGDYGMLAHIFRPGHADFGFHMKYGFRDYRGGGRSSGRETLSRVAGGAVAQRFLATQDIYVYACTMELGGIAAQGGDSASAAENPYFCPGGAGLEETVNAWEERIRAVKKQGDTIGGLVRVEVHGVPAGLGEPVFDKLDARLAYALMSVGAVKGVAVGDGFSVAGKTGSENNDAMVKPAERADDKGCSCIRAAGTLAGGVPYAFASNHAGGVLGGISNGAPLVITVAVKPIASIAQKQQSLDGEGRPVSVQVGGRHDISAIPRIVPVLKAMTALTVADFILLQRCAVL